MAGWLEKESLPYRESARVLRIVVKSLIEGLPGAPFHGGWLEKATLKRIQNQPQVLHIAVKSLVQGCRVPLPQGAASRKQPSELA